MESSRTAEIAQALRCVKHWLQSGVPANEIAVICCQKWQGEKVVERLEETGIPSLWMGTRGGKLAYDPAAPRVTVVLTPSSKGLEFQAAIVIGIGELDDGEDWKNETRRLYVAMTRAKEQLALCASRKNAFTTRLETLTRAPLSA